jgi:20S proteasome alpha/beta subunit
VTVIVWDGKTLAADKRASYGGMICTVTKIFRVGDRLVGGAGDAAFVLAMVAWVRFGRRGEDFPAAQGSKDDWQPLLVIEPDGKILIYERTAYPIYYEQDCMVVGSGREYARAALHLGKTAAEAVQVAIDLDHNCGNGIDTLELQP